MTYDDWLAYFLGLGIRDERARYMALTAYWYQEKHEAEAFCERMTALVERKFAS